jgi:pimeloyl-ACP methyl ester carboxylesterase
MSGSREAVLLIHGLWMNGLAMFYLEHALKREGFLCDSLSYHSMLGTLSEHVDALAGRIAAIDADTVHLVGHSLGGIVALGYLQGARDRRIGRCVLLGSPVGGSQIARTLAQQRGGGLLLGRSVDVWQSDVPHRIGDGLCVGAIAGSEPFGLASMFMDLPAPSDGVVTIDETRLPGLADHLVLPVSHSGMLISSQVADQVAAFLRRGLFER